MLICAFYDAYLGVEACVFIHLRTKCKNKSNNIGA